MITRLRFINFRSHADTSIDLRPINLFIGPVAAGKSNTFKGLLFLQNLVHRSLVELFPPGLGEFHWVRSRWAAETDPIGLEVDIEGMPQCPGDSARYSIKLTDAPVAGLCVLEETLQRRANNAPWEWVFQRRSHRPALGEYGEVDPREPTILHRVWHNDPRIRTGAPGPRFAKEVARALSNFSYFHLEASALKSLGTGEFRDRIGYNGAWLPDFIAKTKFSEASGHVYDTIREAMREILPELDSIIVTQVKSEEQGLAMSFDGHRGYVAAPDLSDGTVFTLGILSIVHSLKKPAMLCIEEPETGLHPGRLRWLFDRFMGLAYPDDGQTPIQVILSTHSPYLVDFFGDMQECVHVFASPQGRTQVTPFVQLQQNVLHQAPSDGEPIGHLWATGLFENL